MIRLEITAEAVAWYAAIVATASAIVSAYNVMRDRAKLRIEVKPNMKVFPARPEYDPDKTYIIVRVVNAGRRTATLTHVWFEPKKKGAQNILLPDCLNRGPQELSEGKWAIYALEQEAIDLRRFRRICVSDSTGRTYCKKISRRVREMAQGEDVEDTSGQDV